MGEGAGGWRGHLGWDDNSKPHPQGEEGFMQQSAPPLQGDRGQMRTRGERAATRHGTNAPCDPSPEQRTRGTEQGPPRGAAESRRGDRSATGRGSPPQAPSMKGQTQAWKVWRAAVP